MSRRSICLRSGPTTGSPPERVFLVAPFVDIVLLDADVARAHRLLSRRRAGHGPRSGARSPRRGVGAAFGMSIVAGVAGVPLAKLARAKHGAPLMLRLTGVLSLVIGAAWAWPIARRWIGG